MNTEIFNYCLNSLKRRKSSVLRTALVIFLLFTFVAGVTLFQNNMYQWQIQSAKERFGNWFIMLYGADKKENAELSSHPYLDESGKATIVNYEYNNKWEATDIKIGYMSDTFIRLGNITLEKGEFPDNDDEVAIERNTLIELNQGTDIGQDITINTIIKGETDTEKITKTYKLTGIIDSYTNVWEGGSNVPGIIVTENASKSIKRKSDAVYIYSAGSYVDGDYCDIYEGLKKKVRAPLIYNSSVYDYEPWGGSYIYDYMYIILFLVGIAGIAYQLSVYGKERKNAYDILKGLGASRFQLICMGFIDNVVIVILSSLIGLIISIGIGRMICYLIEGVTGIKFFSIDKSIYISFLIMVAGACVAGCVVSLFRQKVKKHKVNRRVCRKHTLNKHNYIHQTHRRFMYSQGLIQNICIRLFSLIMMMMIIVSVVNSVKAYKEYKDNSDKTDIIGFKQQDKDAVYAVYYATENYVTKSGIISGPEDLKEKFYNTADNITKEDYIHRYGPYGPGEAHYLFRNAYLKYNIKNADAFMYKGIDDSLIDYIQNITGVNNIIYGYYDTARVWKWDGIDYNKVGIPYYEDYGFNMGRNLEVDGKKYEKYLFATEYVTSDSKIYDILCDYVDTDSFDYEEFRRGEAAIIFIDKNPEGEYDDTLIEGKQVGLMCYPIGDNAIDVEDSNSYDKAIYNYMVDNGILVDDSINVEYFNDIDETQMEAKINTRLENLENLYGVEVREVYEKNLESLRETIIFQNSLDKQQDYKYYLDYVPAATTKVASVIYVDDNIKHRLKEYIPEFGLYTMLAADELGRKAVDTQNELLKRYLMLDELPKELTLDMKYNQVNIKYGLDSVYNGTVNAVTSYLRQAGFSYNSYSEEKDLIKNKTVEALILYSFTAVVAALVYIVVLILVLKKRIEVYQERMRILRNTGADKNTIFRIYMCECIREALWCIILMPFMLILEVLIVKKAVRRLE